MLINRGPLPFGVTIKLYFGHPEPSVFGSIIISIILSLETLAIVSSRRDTQPKAQCSEGGKQHNTIQNSCHQKKNTFGIVDSCEISVALLNSLPKAPVCGVVRQERTNLEKKSPKSILALLGGPYSGLRLRIRSALNETILTANKQQRTRIDGRGCGGSGKRS